MHEPAPASLLRERPFVQFWIARACTTVAFHMQAVAVGWQMYELTRNPLDLGLVGLVQFVPAFVFVLLAGHMADRYDRRRIVAVAMALAGLASALLAIGTAGAFVTRTGILAIVFVVGVGRAFESPTTVALLPALVRPALLSRAVAASSAVGQTGMIIGPAIGGTLYAVSPVLLYGLCCGLFLAGSMLIWLLRVNAQEIVREPVTLARLFAGITFMGRNSIVCGVIVLDLFAVLLGGVTALLPIFARDILMVGPWGLGVLRAAPGVGALIVSVLLTHVPLTRRVGRAIFLSVAGFGLATLLFGVSTSLFLSVVALIAVGGTDMISVVARMTLIQFQTPDDMRGRVGAVNSMFVVASNQLGDFRAGLMAAWVGAVPAVLIGALGTLTAVLLCWRLFPALARVDRFESAQSKAAKPV
jgi:MFS family permease